MKKSMLFCLCLVPLLAWALDQPAAPAAYWSQWRGPLATGAAPYSTPPIAWSETENIRWKVAIPGQGHASPIVWGDRVFVLTAIQTEASFAQEKPAAEEGGRSSIAGAPIPKSLVMSTASRSSPSIAKAAPFSGSVPLAKRSRMQALIRTDPGLRHPRLATANESMPISVRMASTATIWKASFCGLWTWAI